MTLRNRVIAVTGASGGIGSALVARLAAVGSEVILGVGPGEQSRFAEPAQALDVTDSASLTAFAAAIDHRYGRLDGIVTLAGVMEQASVDELTDDTWEHILRVNLTGTFRTIRAMLPLLRRSPVASVVTISSQLAYTGALNTVAYSASKAGILGLTRALAHELGPQIRVNAVAPGPVKTDMTAALIDTPGWVERKTQRQVQRRFADPMEITGPILFLLSDESSFMTGQTLSPNGGGVMP